MSDLDRRAFLAGAVSMMGAGVTAGPLRKVGDYAGSLFPDSALPSAAAIASSHGSGSFLSGELRDARSDRLIVAVVDGFQQWRQRIRLTESTEICKITCHAMSKDLRRGDRVDCGLYVGDSGVPIARFVNANFMSGWGEVVGFDDGAILLNVPKDYRDWSEAYRYTLTVTPSTNMGRFDGSGTAGDMSCWNRGDYLHFTATAASRTARPTAGWGLSLNQATMRI